MTREGVAQQLLRGWRECVSECVSDGVRGGGFLGEDTLLPLLLASEGVSEWGSEGLGALVVQVLVALLPAQRHSLTASQRHALTHSQPHSLEVFRQVRAALPESIASSCSFLQVSPLHHCTTLHCIDFVHPLMMTAHSLTHSLTQLITHPLTHPLTQSLTQFLTQLLTHSINQSITHLLVYAYARV
jgi:hypothetical protein